MAAVRGWAGLANCPVIVAGLPVGLAVARTTRTTTLAVRRGRALLDRLVQAGY
jgi:hypothetical protein